MAVALQVREHMEVVSSAGQHGRRVDRVEGSRSNLVDMVRV